MIDVVASDLDFTPLHERMQFYVDENILPCCNTLVMRGTDVLDVSLHGWSVLDARQPLAEDTLFRVYSNTKIVTSVAAMMLYEEGRFALDDPLAKHLPAFADLTVLKPDAERLEDVESLTREPTIAHVMSHSAGFSYGFVQPDSVIDRSYAAAGLGGLASPIESLEDLVARLARLPLANQPGTRWRYSFATDVLARLVEVWSGERFSAFLKRRIFAPLGMWDTDFYVPEDKRDRFAGLYLPADPLQPMVGGLTLSDDPRNTQFAEPPGYEAGGHGLVSTLPDYLAIVRMLVNGGEWNGTRFLTPETLALMRTNQLPSGTTVQFMMALPGTSFGLGFALTEQVPEGLPDYARDEYYWGGIAGTHSFMAPHADLALICMTQRMPAFLHPFQLDFRRLAYSIAGRA